jgi:hypothetical protein
MDQFGRVGKGARHAEFPLERNGARVVPTRTDSYSSRTAGACRLRGAYLTELSRRIAWDKPVEWVSAPLTPALSP